MFFFFFFLPRSYISLTAQNDEENTLPGLGVVFAGGVVVVWGGVVNAGVVVAAEIQVSNDGDGKPCCRICNKQTRTK